LENLNIRQEDYIKAIYFLSKHKKGGWVSNTEISHYLNVKPSSVTSMLVKLREKNLIEWRPRKSLRLTEKGREMARTLIKKYKVLRNFFINILHIDDSPKINELCCKLEHLVTMEITKALEDLN